MAGGFLAFRCGNYENTAEREQFRLLCENMKTRFATSNTFYLLVGNYNIYDCEFDAILIKHDAIIAIEFKNYGGNIIACENGEWTSNGTIIKGGSRKTVYQQARVNHTSLRKGLKDLGIERKWLKDIPSIIVFNQNISLDNQLSGRVRSWLHITDNSHFVDKIEDITCASTDLSNIDIIDLAIKLNLNPFLIKEFSSYTAEEEKENSCTVEQRDANDIQLNIDLGSNPESQYAKKNYLGSYDRFTPNHIFNLRPNQMFVFGTDRKGSQRYGAAGLAANKFGAQVGVIDGPTGNCYALPTKGFGISELDKAVTRFIEYVKAHSQLTFLVTPVGCGHAGLNLKQVACMFKELIGYENVMLPEAFIKEYQIECNQEKFVVPVDTICSEKDQILSSILQSYDERLHDVVRFLFKHGIEFNPKGGFTIQDESGVVIGEAELGIPSEKIIFFPFNSQSERVFKNNGFAIFDPIEYLNSKSN